MSTAQLKLGRGKNRPVADVCQGGLVRVGFKPSRGLEVNMERKSSGLEVDMERNEMLKFHFRESFRDGVGARDYEILYTFFNSQKLNPTFINNNVGGVGSRTGMIQMKVILIFGRPNMLFISGYIVIA